MGALALLLALAFLIGALALWSNPRYRALDRDRPSEARTGAGPARGAAGPPAAVVAPPAPPGARPAAPGADGRIRLPVADRVPTRLPADGAPAGWVTKEFVGRASIELVRDGTRLALRLRSEQTSFALYRDVVVDPNEFRFLAWSWKVVLLPDGGDVRERSRDDQAAQLYVIFPRWPAPLTTSDVIGYVWDSRAPVGTRITSPRAANVRIIVVASGGAERGAWRLEERDLSQDYVALFGRQPPRIGRVAVMIDTNDTGGVAEALLGDIVFAKARVENMEIPTSMLR